MDLLTRAVTKTSSASSSSRSTSFFIDPKDVSRVQSVLLALSKKVKETEKKLEESQKEHKDLTQRLLRQECALQLVSAENARLHAYLNGYLSPLLEWKDWLVNRERDEAARNRLAIIEKFAETEEQLRRELETAVAAAVGKRKATPPLQTAAERRNSYRAGESTVLVDPLDRRRTTNGVAGQQLAAADRSNGARRGEEHEFYVENLDIEDYRPPSEPVRTPREQQQKVPRQRKRSVTPSRRSSAGAAGQFGLSMYTDPKPKKLGTAGLRSGSQGPSSQNKNNTAVNNARRTASPSVGSMNLRILGDTNNVKSGPSHPLRIANNSVLRADAFENPRSRDTRAGGRLHGDDTRRNKDDADGFLDDLQLDGLTPIRPVGAGVGKRENYSANADAAIWGAPPSSLEGPERLKQFLAQRDERISRLENENNKLLKQMTSSLLQR